MKKILSLILAVMLLMSVCGIAALAEDAPAGLTINVTVPADYEGELNGRLLFCVDYAIPGRAAKYSTISM